MHFASLFYFELIKALLTLETTDCNCALSVQGHRQFWPLHEHRPIDQPWETARYRMSYDTDAGPALTFEGACLDYGPYKRAS